jgi:ketosteroid isomerase-like protein
MNELQQEVWDTVQEMNRCWTSDEDNDLDGLNEYFHETMVAITPSDKHRIEGKSACVAGWQDFARKSKIHSWKELDPDVQAYGNTAVVTYYYDMSFDMGGQTINTWGRDMMTLIKENGKWWLVADQFSGYNQ